MKIVIATSNKNKIVEIKNKFSEIKDLEIIPLSDYNSVPEIIEDGRDFSENAMKKARNARDFTGEISLADDSGLVVDALGGEPGIYSARYGGENLTDIDRYNLILEKMQKITESYRSARFICSIAMAFPDGDEFCTDGVCEGMITFAPRGSKGFGYDPVFYIPELGCTMAEISLDDKNRISHRARALESACRLLLEKLRQAYMKHNGSKIPG